jgi:hypothetical protein
MLGKAGAASHAPGQLSISILPQNTAMDGWMIMSDCHRQFTRKLNLI